jgi:hypothetical protein
VGKYQGEKDEEIVDILNFIYSAVVLGKYGEIC